VGGNFLFFLATTALVVYVCLDEVMHVVALARINRLLLCYPLSTLFDYFESRAHRKIIYVR